MRLSAGFVWLCLLVPASLFAQDMPLTQVLIEGEEWELVGEGYKFTEGPAVDREGNVFFTDVPGSAIYRIDAQTGEVTPFLQDIGKPSGLMFGKDGLLYACLNGDRKVVKIGMGEEPDIATLAEDVNVNDLVVDDKGGVYVTDPQNQSVWYITPQGGKQVVAKGFRPNGIILTMNGSTLVVTDSDQPVLWTFRVKPDGTLDAGEKYYGPLMLPSGQEKPGSDGMTIDQEGRLYVATHAGLQMFDPTGRLGGVIAKPQPAFLSNVVFGGPEMKTLYVTSADKVFRRKVKPTGVRH